MAASAGKRTFRSGELAKLLGVSRDTLRVRHFAVTKLAQLRERIKEMRALESQL